MAHDAASIPEQESRRLPWADVVLAATGLLLGVVAKVADESAVTWLSTLGDHPGIWVLIVAVIGRTAPTLARAALRAAALAVAMCVGYYAWSIGVLGFGWGRFVLVWLALAVTAVPMSGAAVWWATRRAGFLPGAVMGVLAGVVLTGGAIRGLVLHAAGHLPLFATRPVQAVLEAAMVACLVAVLPRYVPTLLWAAALLLPAWWTADVVSRLVGAVF